MRRSHVITKGSIAATPGKRHKVFGKIVDFNVSTFERVKLSFSRPRILLGTTGISNKHSVIALVDTRAEYRSGNSLQLLDIQWNYNKYMTSDVSIIVAFLLRIIPSHYTSLPRDSIRKIHRTSSPTWSLHRFFSTSLPSSQIYHGRAES